LTISPSDVHSRIILALAGFKIETELHDNADEEDFSANMQAYVASRDPVSAAKYFDAVVSAVFEILVGDCKGGKRGIFGEPGGYNGFQKLVLHLDLDPLLT
jgi:hypothetical protein